MKNFLVPFLFFSLSTVTYAQFGLSAHYLDAQGDEWIYRPNTTTESTATFPGTGFMVGIDYWFRLRNARIEFLPTLAFSTQSQSATLTSGEAMTNLSAYHLFFNTNIYPFDLQGDCDCPTFSKEGPSLQKGLYIQLSPGYSFFQHEVNYSDAITTSLLQENSAALNIGVGLGFDLGLSDLLTITPHAGLRYYPAIQWQGITEIPVFTGEENSESSVTQYQLGLRLGIRLDQ